MKNLIEIGRNELLIQTTNETKHVNVVITNKYLGIFFKFLVINFFLVVYDLCTYLYSLLVSTSPILLCLPPHHLHYSSYPMSSRNQLRPNFPFNSC